MAILFLILLICMGLTTALFFLLKKSSIFLSVDVGGAIFNGVVAVYAILLGFIVVLVWQQYQNTSSRIQQEASKAFNIYRSSHALPDSSGQQVRTAVSTYIRSVCHDEWPAMEHDSACATTQQLYQSIWTTLAKIEPATESQKIWYASMVQSLNELGEARTMRTSGTGQSVPTLMWIILVLGAVITIGFASLLEGRNLRTTTHLIKVILFALLLVLNGILIYLLDHPYKGLLRIEPDAYQKIINAHPLPNTKQ